MHSLLPLPHARTHSLFDVLLLRLVLERQLVLVPLQVLNAHLQLLVDLHPRVVHLAQGRILFR